MGEIVPLVDFSNPIYILVAVIIFILVTLLGRETKRSFPPLIMLFIFLAVLAGHGIEFVLTEDPTGNSQALISSCITIDFLFILISFFVYLWADDMEAKDKKLKSVDNSLDWFWKKV